ncbi:MAG TPA: competence/damage-inducible protein A [Polyangiaceae bacterium]|nr:competence/damage-inducible protein A [Polyangiaceae bacterium]
MRTAAALVIGNELLSGKIADENVVVLARTLQGIGVRLERVVMVPDDLDVIVDDIRGLSERYDVVFTSGGVGPTHDDLTVDAIAAAFEVEVVPSPPMEAMLRQYYGDKITEGHLRMARAPAGARLVTSDAMPWPTVVMRNVWILPGVPQIFAMKMEVVASDLGADGVVHSVALFTTLDEGHLKPMLDEVVAEYEDVAIGSYPRWRDARYRTKVTFDHQDRGRCEAARDALVARLDADAVVEVNEGS